jgi:hypothetical protein
VEFEAPLIRRSFVNFNFIAAGIAPGTARVVADER